MNVSDDERKVFECIPDDGTTEQDLIDTLDMDFLDVINTIVELEEKGLIESFKSNGLKKVHKKVETISPEENVESTTEEEGGSDQTGVDVIDTIDLGEKVTELLEDKEMDVTFNKESPGKLYTFLLSIYSLSKYPDGVKIADIDNDISKNTKSYTLKRLEDIDILERDSKYGKKYYLTPQFVKWMADNIDIDAVLSLLRSIKQATDGE